jgi:hypothetical protein
VVDLNEMLGVAAIALPAVRAMIAVAANSVVFIKNPFFDAS